MANFHGTLEYFPENIFMLKMKGSVHGLFLYANKLEMNGSEVIFIQAGNMIAKIDLQYIDTVYRGFRKRSNCFNWIAVLTEERIVL